MKTNKRLNVPLLSICIPTYNRANYLKDALENITSDPAFDERIEVVISDNASSDNTQEVGQEYASKFANIKYFRNTENVRDANFKLALHRATGKYLKLSNDTLRYKKGSLSVMVRTIERTREENALFFYQSTIFSSQNRDYIVHNNEEFLNYTSYFIGWIANFGIWRSDLDCLEVPKLYTDLQFVQVAWTFEILTKHGKAVLNFGDFYYTEEPSKKATYNLFKVQQSNLLRIYRNYNIKILAFEREKFRLFRYHILPLLYNFVYCKQETAFDLSDAHKTIFRDYWYLPYMYPALLIKKVKSIWNKHTRS